MDPKMLAKMKALQKMQEEGGGVKEAPLEKTPAVELYPNAVDTGGVTGAMPNAAAAGEGKDSGWASMLGGLKDFGASLGNVMMGGKPKMTNVPSPKAPAMEVAPGAGDSAIVQAKKKFDRKKFLHDTEEET